MTPSLLAKGILVPLRVIQWPASTSWGHLAILCRLCDHSRDVQFLGEVGQETTLIQDLFSDGQRNPTGLEAPVGH